MTPEQAAELRKPFPKTAIGILPKPYSKDSPKSQCRECNGYHGQPAVHLDYVGHAATTDRLLAVDPEWTWEPVAVDEQGLPAIDRAGNLWIRLTVCGVTRLGVGDGKSAKEAIGDAIRNAAMRFGVALDLWSKEELEGAHVPAPPPEPMAAKTRAHMFALFGQKGVPDDKQLAGINQITGAGYTSRGDLTEADAQRVIAALKQRPDAEAGQ